MKNIIIILLIPYIVLTACHSSKSTAAKTATNTVTTTKTDSMELNGTWELDYFAESTVDLKILYPDQKPFLRIDVIQKSINGNSGCNNFNGPLKVEGNKINFSEPMAMTRMFCQDGSGESTFLQALAKVTTYSVKEKNTLQMMSDKVLIMQFKKKD